MMFVQGDNFALYVDMRFTSLPETTFRSLPTLQGVDPLAYCDARWCNGPGPTPTPTGSGPLLSVLVGSTPVATPNVGVLAASKQLVSWNQVRVTYVFDNLQTHTAQVALEVCAQAAQNATACEPVISIFDNNVGRVEAGAVDLQRLERLRVPIRLSEQSDHRSLDHVFAGRVDQRPDDPLITSPLQPSLAVPSPYGEGTFSPPLRIVSPLSP